MRSTWDRIVELIEAVSAKTRIFGIVAVAAGAFVVIRAAGASGRWWWLAGAAALVALLPGLAVWDFARAIGQLPKVPRETLDRTVDAASSGLDAGNAALGELRTGAGGPAKLFALVRNLFTLRGALGQLRGVLGGAIWLKRLASPLYLVVVAVSLPLSAVIVLIGLVLVVAAA